MVDFDKDPAEVQKMDNPIGALYLLPLIESARACTAFMTDVPAEVSEHLDWLVTYLWNSLPDNGFRIEYSGIGLD